MIDFDKQFPSLKGYIEGNHISNNTMQKIFLDKAKLINQINHQIKLLREDFAVKTNSSEINILNGKIMALEWVKTIINL